MEDISISMLGEPVGLQSHQRADESLVNEISPPRDSHFNDEPGKVKGNFLSVSRRILGERKDSLSKRGRVVERQTMSIKENKNLFPRTVWVGYDNTGEIPRP